MAELLTLPRMARRAGVTAKWLQEAAEQGIVPSLQAGRRLLFNSEVTIAALTQLAAGSAPDDKEPPQDGQGVRDE